MSCGNYSRYKIGTTFVVQFLSSTVARYGYKRINDNEAIPPPSGGAFRRGHSRENSTLRNTDALVSPDNGLNSSTLSKSTTFPTSTPPTGALGPGAARAAEQPIRQPYGPPLLEEIRGTPTTGCLDRKNFATRQSRIAVQSIAKDAKKEARKNKKKCQRRYVNASDARKDQSLSVPPPAIKKPSVKEILTLAKWVAHYAPHEIAPSGVLTVLPDVMYHRRAYYSLYTSQDPATLAANNSHAYFLYGLEDVDNILREADRRESTRPARLIQEDEVSPDITATYEGGGFFGVLDSEQTL